VSRALRGDRAAEVSRILDLGATLLTGRPVVEDGWQWHTLADLDGNEFCVLQPPGGRNGVSTAHGPRQMSAGTITVGAALRLPRATPGCPRPRAGRPAARPGGRAWARGAVRRVSLAVSEFGQLGARRRDPHAARTEIHQGGVNLDADDPAEAVGIVGNLIPHGELLSRRSGGWGAEGTSGQEAPGRGAGWLHPFQYAAARHRLRQADQAAGGRLAGPVQRVTDLAPHLCSQMSLDGGGDEGRPAPQRMTGGSCGINVEAASEFGGAGGGRYGDAATSSSTAC
jgi:Glyoxalase-like domain